MNEIEKYQKYMSFKAHFKNIPIISSLIRTIKWKYYKPYSIKKWTKNRLNDYTLKMQGRKSWDKKEKDLLSLKDSHIGEVAFIIGNGPSLRQEDLDVLKSNNVFCFAMNRINLIFDKTTWRPNCYMAIDPQIYRENDPTVPTIINEKLPLYLFGDFAYKGIPETMLSANVIPFNSKPNSHYISVSEFSDNALLYVVDGFTVTYSAMQIAYYMGFKKIYLLGIDFNYSRKLQKNGKIIDSCRHTYFDDKYDPYNKNAGYMDGMMQAYETAKKFCDSHDFKIFNATRGGNLNVFERISFEDVIESL